MSCNLYIVRHGESLGNLHGMFLGHTDLELTEKGKNLETLFEDILFSLRSVEISAILPDASSVLEESPEQLQKFKTMAAIAPLSVIQDIMEILSVGARPLRDALNKQIYLETLLLKAMKQDIVFLSEAVKSLKLVFVAQLSEYTTNG